MLCLQRGTRQGQGKQSYRSQAGALHTRAKAASENGMVTLRQLQQSKSPKVFPVVRFCVAVAPKAPLTDLSRTSLATSASCNALVGDPPGCIASRARSSAWTCSESNSF